MEWIFLLVVLCAAIVIISKRDFCDVLHSSCAHTHARHGFNKSKSPKAKIVHNRGAVIFTFAYTPVCMQCVFSM